MIYLLYASALCTITSVSAWCLMVEVGILHGWWNVIPTMPFMTALSLTVVAVIAGSVVACINAVVDNK